MANENTVEIGVRVNAGDSTAEVRTVANELRHLGDEAKPVAAALAAAEQSGMAWARAAEQAGDVTDETTARYEEFRGTVEQLRASIVETYGSLEDAPADIRATFDGLTQALKGTAGAFAELDRKFGDIPAGIERIRAMSDKTFAEQKALLAGVAKELEKQGAGYSKLGAEGEAGLRRVEAETDRVKRAMEELAAESTTSAGRIRDGIIQTERQFEKFTNTLRDNPKEGLEQLPRVAGAVIQLRQEIQRAQDSGGPVDPQAIARLRQFETQLEGAKNEARNLKLEIDKATAGVQSASGAWMGFDSIVNDLAGRFGKAGLAAAGAAAALTESIQQGRRFNEFIGADMSEWDELMDAVAKRLKSNVDRISDSLVEAGGLITALATMDLSEAKRQFDELRGATEQYDDLLDVQPEKIDASARAHTSYAKTLDTAKTSVVDLTEKQRMMLELIVGQTTTADKYSESTAQLVERIAELAAAREVDTDRLKKYGDAIEDNLERNQNYTQSMRDQVRAINESIAVIESATERRRDAERSATEEIEKAVERANEARLKGDNEAANAAAREIERLKMVRAQKLSDVEWEVTIAKGKIAAANAEIQRSADGLAAATEAAHGRATAAVSTHADAVGTLTRKYNDLAVAVGNYSRAVSTIPDVGAGGEAAAGAATGAADAAASSSRPGITVGSRPAGGETLSGGFGR